MPFKWFIHSFGIGPSYAGGNWKRRFHSGNTSNVFCPPYAGEIWKRSFHSENTPNTSVRTTPEKFETATLDLCLRKTHPRRPKVTYYFSSIVAVNNFWNLPRCAKCKSPLQGSRNYVDRTYEQSANYSALTFSCYRAKAKCNFAVCPLYDRSTMLGQLLQIVWVCFFGEETKTNNETMVGVELLEGYKRAVCGTCRYSIFW